MIYQIKSYLKYKKNAVGKHGVHSPFVYDLLQHVFDKNDQFYAFKAIELVRSSLKMDTTNLSINDLGAGSKQSNAKIKTVRQVVKTASKAPKFGQLLFRLANYFNVNNVIELGTSLGISTAYLSKARNTAVIYSLEGASAMVNQARLNLAKLKATNVEIIEGDFNEKLPIVLKQIEKLDFVFFDGNHKKEATLNYFNQCLAKTHNNTIFVFDDIYWSEEMTEAWEYIKRNKKVTVTIDVFEMGIVFFRTELPKQDFIINY